MKLENLPIGIFIIKNERIEFSSKELCDMLGYKLKEMIGMSVREFFEPEEFIKFRESTSSKEKTRQSELDLSLFHKNRDKKINVRISKNLTKYKGEKVCIGTVRQISEIDKQVEDFTAVLGKFLSFFNESKEPMYISTPNGKLLEGNPAFMELFGYLSRGEFLDANVKNHYLNLKDRENFQKVIEEKGFVKDYKLTLKDRKGESIAVSITADAQRDEKGKVVAYRGIIRDTSKQKTIEERLIHLQKMEALGRLASEIAHDFNNLLTVIIGNSEILMNKTDPLNPDYDKIRTIFETAEKASNFTSQLLSFSRGEESSPVNFNPNTLIQKLNKSILRIFGKNMTLSLSLSPELSFIKADPVRIEQVILNLVINAKDAMKEGGTLSISTENEELKAEDCFENPESKPGKYVVIKISDTGTGINPEIIDRIFEPFFTTKEKGTGLGLSIVYGIVKQAGGFINVESIYGEGTTFKIYLPASEEKIDMLSIQEKESKETLDNLKGRILVIEDDPSVLEFIKDFLEISGFEVITASSGEEGIEKARKFKKEISFLLADVILPNKNGIETAKEIRKILPEIKLIFMSGYPLNKISKIFEVKNAEFLQKPLSPSLLIEKIRNSLQRRKQKANSSMIDHK